MGEFILDELFRFELLSMLGCLIVRLYGCTKISRKTNPCYTRFEVCAKLRFSFRKNFNIIFK